MPACTAPSVLNIGHWLWEGHKEDDRQCWIGAYACSLQHMAEASDGWSWTIEGKTMVPEISSLVETFMAVTGTHMPLHAVQQCWPIPYDQTPVQDLKGIKEDIVHRLDKVAMQSPSTIAWDRFAFPKMDQKYWREEVLCHYPGKALDVGALMLGFHLMLQMRMDIMQA